MLSDNANFHGESIAKFPRILSRAVKGPNTIIWDSVRIHLAEPVRNYLSATKGIITETFPPNAPNLNPVDSVWLASCSLSHENCASERAPEKWNPAPGQVYCLAANPVSPGSFPNAELTENAVQEIFGGGFTDDLADGVDREAQVQSY